MVIKVLSQSVKCLVVSLTTHPLVPRLGIGAHVPLPLCHVQEKPLHFLLLYQLYTFVVLALKLTSCPLDGSCDLLPSCRAALLCVPSQCFVVEGILVQ